MTKARWRCFVVAIDGPAGSGKSTTARLVAEQLGFFHLDTGAMYRAVTLKVIQSGTDHSSPRSLARMLAGTAVRMSWRQGAVRVALDGKDVSDAIRRPEVSALVSDVSALPAVRRKMVAEQRRIARGRSIVCEGRDITSVVFPNAQLKVYLDCDPGARAHRRRLELAGQGSRVRTSAVVANLRKRDRTDTRRRMSPLTRVPDAVLVDTTWLSIDEQVRVVCNLARRRLAAAS